MSTASQLRREKRPSPESGNPRRFGRPVKRSRFDLTAFQKLCHESSKSSPRIKHGGAFGGVTKAKRAELQAIKEAQRGQKEAA